MRNYIGEHVKHKFSGEGIVIAQADDKNITVEYKSQTNSVRLDFDNPYFAFVNSDIQQEVVKMIEEKRAAEIAKNSKMTDDALYAVNKYRVEGKNKGNRSTAVPTVINGSLEHNQSVGTAAHNIYDACCDAFDWDVKKKGFFGLRKSLYSPDTTPEGYAAWAIANSNRTRTKNGKWRNIISEDSKTISTIWDNPSDPAFNDQGPDVVTFAKESNNEYIFLGIYRCIDINPATATKTYTMIANNYRAS